MDPLSVTASVLAVTGVAVQVAKKLRKLRGFCNPSGEIHAVENEIADLQAVFKNIERIIAERKDQSNQAQEQLLDLVNSLKRAKEVLLELDSILNYRLIGSYTVCGEPKFARVAWIRERSKVKTLQEDLRGVRLQLITQLSVLHA